MKIVGPSAGFTLIEILMVIVLVAILASVAITQLIDFREEARTAQAHMLLGALRTGISIQKGNMILRCGAPTDAWPAAADIQANDITNGGSVCTPAHLPNSVERRFLAQSQGFLPQNPLGTPPDNTVFDCQDFGTCSSVVANAPLPLELFGPLLASSPLQLWPILKMTLSRFFLPLYGSERVHVSAPCRGSDQAFSGGWCYNSRTGGIWADAPPRGHSSANTGGEDDGGDDDDGTKDKDKKGPPIAPPGLNK